jgi:ribosome-binding ATPase YchF (GTP1/OBG family)
LALEVGIIGLPNAGKTTLFNALTGAGAHPAKENVGMVAVPDERLAQVAEVARARKATPAQIRVVDVGGWGAALLGRLRQVDVLLAVLAAYAPGADPEGDATRIELELLVADRDHVERRIERVEKQAKSGDAALKRELEDLRRALAHLDAGKPLQGYPDPLPEGLEPLTTKPLITVVNGPGGVDLQLEAELAELPAEEAAAFRDGGTSALEDVVRRVFASLDLVTFLTADENEARAWTLRRGATALDAAAAIHSDMAHGFVRCEVVRWDDLVACGSTAEAAKRGLARLEGKTYVVADGDVLRIRFSR